MCIVLNALDVLELCLIEFFLLRDLMNRLVCLCSDIALDFSPKPMGVCFSRSSRENFFALSLSPKVQSASFLFLQPLCLFTALDSLWNSPAQDAGMSATV